MAERRMISRRIFENDTFCSLPLVSRNLYVYLMLAADDEGFIANPKKIMKTFGAKMHHFLSLIDSNYIMEFDSGVVVITHWHTHNKISAARLTNTQHVREKTTLALDKTGAYYRVMTDVRATEISLECDDDLSSEDSKEEKRKEKERKVKNSIEKNNKDKDIESSERSDIDSLPEFRDLANLLSKKRSELGVSSHG